MPRTMSTRPRFATRALLLQLATMTLVVALCTGVYLLLTVQQLRAEAESTALGIARTLAEDPQVRAEVTRISLSDGTPDAAELRDGDLQRIASDVTSRTGALFVVLTDDNGIRLAHPTPSRIGEVVSTPYEEVLAGAEVVDWQTGTLGESARAKVPVRNDAGTPVGEVSVGFERAGVFDDLPPLLTVIGVTAAGALALAGLAFLLLRRRWERLTFGVQPEELVALVQNQTAVLDGVDDGVIAVDPRGVVRVSNAAADRLLGLHDPIGRPIEELGLATAVLEAATGARTRSRAIVGDRMLYLDSRPVVRDGHALGDVLIVRDRTDLVALTERLETVRTMTAALRVQRHEFANRMHVAAGLIDADRVREARTFLGELVERGPVVFPVVGLDLLGDPFLHSFLGAKGVEAESAGWPFGSRTTPSCSGPSARRKTSPPCSATSSTTPLPPPSQASGDHAGSRSPCWTTATPSCSPSPIRGPASGAATRGRRRRGSRMPPETCTGTGSGCPSRRRSPVGAVETSG